MTPLRPNSENKIAGVTALAVSAEKASYKRTPIPIHTNTILSFANNILEDVFPLLSIFKKTI